MEGWVGGCGRRVYCGEYIMVILGLGIGVAYRLKDVVYIRLIPSACL